MKTFSGTGSIILSIAFFIFSSCSSTKLVSSWRSPDATVDVNKLQKVWVMCLVKDESTRRVAEDELAKRQPGVFFPTYNEYPSSAMKADPEKINTSISQSGYDGIVIMRLVSKEQATSYVPGSSPAYYGGWHGYYGYASPYYYDPGYYRTDQYYTVETNVYSIKQDKLLWTGMTETVNPGSVETTIREIADAINFQMKKEGFLASGSKETK